MSEFERQILEGVKEISDTYEILTILDLLRDLKKCGAPHEEVIVALQNELRI